MASAHPIEAVLNCRKDAPQKVYMLGIRLLKGLYELPLVFPNPKVSKTVFEAAVLKLSTLLAISKGNSNNIKECRALAVVVHNYIKELLLFVKPICKENIDLINKSGFDSSRHHKKHGVPRKPTISKVVKVGGFHSYKVNLTKLKTMKGVDADPDTHQRDVKFTVELTLTPDIPESWKKVCVSAPSTKLIVDEVFPGERNYIRVYGTNSAGHGEFSNNDYFTPSHL